MADLLISAALSAFARRDSTSSKRCKRNWQHWPGYREGINAHLTAAIEQAEESPGGLLMPDQSLLYTGRIGDIATQR
ncbi:MAG: 4-hydroxyphenylacetate 3-hydroxylase C-terminal domain-containing protein [Thermomicrobiales bacterium]